ncbi:hypothetical protein A4U88_1456 [Serratia marcescens]|nr:hypothetical protein A4U88_1456 [Serratia marcescens]
MLIKSKLTKKSDQLISLLIFLLGTTFNSRLFDQKQTQFALRITR